MQFEEEELDEGEEEVSTYIHGVKDKWSKQCFIKLHNEISDICVKQDQDEEDEDDEEEGDSKVSSDLDYKMI